MKKYLIYAAIGVIIAGVLIYYLGEAGILATLFGSGIAGSKVFHDKKRKLEEEERQIEQDLKEIDDKLKEEPKDMTPEEEVEYWRNQ